MCYHMVAINFIHRIFFNNFHRLYLSWRSADLDIPLGACVYGSMEQRLDGLPTGHSNHEHAKIDTKVTTPLGSYREVQGAWHGCR